mgnify:CR=1 FL=1
MNNQPTSSLLGSQLDDDSDDDDDGIQVTIGNIKSGTSIFPPARQNSRTSTENFVQSSIFFKSIFSWSSYSTQTTSNTRY